MLYVGAMFGVLAVDIFTTTAMRMNEALQIRIEPECFLEVAIPAPPKAVDQRKRTAWVFRVIPKGEREEQPQNYRVDDPMELGMPKVPNVPSSIGHVAGGWRKEELLNRANDWADGGATSRSPKQVSSSGASRDYSRAPANGRSGVERALRNIGRGWLIVAFSRSRRGGPTESDAVGNSVCISGLMAATLTSH
jgi:hypothetical protein